MRSITAAFAIILVLFTAACQDTASKIVSKKDGVVAIMTEKSSGGPESERAGLGTGWFLKENYIVTNFHVVGNAKKIMVVGERGDDLYEAEAFSQACGGPGGP